MKTGLVGYTGFVGGYLREIFPDASLYNSRNISEIAGESFDLLLISAMPAEKWKANKFPDEDKENLESLKAALTKVKAERVLLISTVDVFEAPTNILETDVPIPSVNQAYGTNRRNFEEFIETNFPQPWIVRLPGLVGKGLKKNVIYDIKHGKPTSGVPINSIFQFYPMSWLKQDLKIVLKLEPGYFHFAVEPISMLEICQEFGLDEESFASISTTAPMYDFRTERANAWEKSGHYLLNKKECLKAIGRYLNDI
jgi:hypothetical protein